MGLRSRLEADGTLRGELTFPRATVLHPVTKAPIARATFIVEEHDSFRFVEAPLSGLDPVKFYDAPDAPSLEPRVAAALAARLQALTGTAAQFRALKFEPQLDVERLAATAVLRTSQAVFHMRGSPAGVAVVRVEPLQGAPFETSFPVSLGEFQSTIDLELFLTEALARMVPSAAPASGAPSSAVARTATLKVLAPAANAMTAAMLAEKFGPDAVIKGGAMLEVFQDFDFGGQRVRFTAVHQSGTVFKAAVVTREGSKWEDKFALAHFPGIEQVVCTVLGIKAEKPAPAAGLGESAEAPVSTIPSHLMPSVGENWVMNVVVEKAADDEVRYVCMDIDGRPYGASRVLQKAEFERSFSQLSNGWCLRITIDAVNGGTVTYRQLDKFGTAQGDRRALAVNILVANFVPEAMAY